MNDFKKLSRAEMKKVSGGGKQPPQCTVGEPCSFIAVGVTVFGTCELTCDCSAGGPPCTLGDA